MTDIGSQLKENLPQFQKGFTNLDEFLDAVGLLLDGFSNTIDEFKYYSDYEKIDEEHVGVLAEQLGLGFPSNIALERKRQSIKNSISRFRSNGTERALKEIFRLIGWNVTIQYCWALNPENPSPEILSPLSIGSYDVVYGVEVIYPDGYTYADIYDEGYTTYDQYPIVGEKYFDDTIVGKVIKIPYIKIIINSEDYDLSTADIVDPITGETFSYTTSEEYSLTQNVINYFLEESRSANLAILDIITPFTLSDTYSTDIVTPITETDLTFETLSAGALYDGTVTYGVQMDRYILGETYDIFQYGNTYMAIIPSPAPITVPRTYAIGTTGTQNYVPTRLSASIDLTVPSDASVRVYSTVSDRRQLQQGTAVWTVVGTYSNIITNIPISGKFAVYANILTPSAIGNIIFDVNQL